MCNSAGKPDASLKCCWISNHSRLQIKLFTPAIIAGRLLIHCPSSDELLHQLSLPTAEQQELVTRVADQTLPCTKQSYVETGGLGTVFMERDVPLHMVLVSCGRYALVTVTATACALKYCHSDFATCDRQMHINLCTTFSLQTTQGF